MMCLPMDITGSCDMMGSDTKWVVSGGLSGWVSICWQPPQLPAAEDGDTG